MTLICVYCGATEGITVHHIVPKYVRKMLNWNGKKAERFLLKKKIPMCRSCHGVFNTMTEPLIYIMKCLRPTPPIPVELAFIIVSSLEKVGVEVDEREQEGLKEEVSDR